MAFTCGPHHWVHGLHLGMEGRSAGTLDLVAVAIGLPAGLIWFSLRVEAFSGGRGDRFVSGSPLWVLALPTALAVYVTALAAAAIGIGNVQIRGDDMIVVLPNILLVMLYGAIAYYLARTQVGNRKPLGGWSLSGLALAVVFATCALMHGVYAIYSMTGQYGPDVHGVGIDVLAVPAAVYFLWVVQALYRGTFRDWNGAPSRRTAAPAAAPARAVGEA
jgi:hypothetical protein